jgi:hypothetical protein
MAQDYSVCMDNLGSLKRVALRWRFQLTSLRLWSSGEGHDVSYHVNSSFHKELITLKRPYTRTGPHGVTAQKQALCIITAIKPFHLPHLKTKSHRQHC